MLRKVNILITGAPGSGKSTLLQRVVERARHQGVRVGGISTPEFRLGNGRRGGFLIRNVLSGTEQTMAAVDIESPIRVGRYGVNLSAIRDVGVVAIRDAMTSADLILIDEIGKMELAVLEFQESVIMALDSSKPVLGTIGLQLRTPFVKQIKERNDITLLTLTLQNRSSLNSQISQLLGL
ncbi:MAG: NTPase [Candidatus Hodarchaeota archaeon]